MNKSTVLLTEMSRMAATTEITLDPPEFDNYTIGVDGEITFCLKELRVSDITMPLTMTTGFRPF